MNRAAEPYRKVNQIVNAFAASRVLHVASELDLFTVMATRARRRPSSRASNRRARRR